MPSNRIDAVLLDERKIQSGFNMIVEALPFLINLTPTDRAEMAKFGEKNRSFVVKALAIAEANPHILQASFDMTEFCADVDLVEGIYPLHNVIEAYFGKLDDTYFAAGSEASAAALLVYQYARLHNIATGALEDSLDDLGRRFARKSKKQTPPA
jgi:hypothetical protein